MGSYLKSWIRIAPLAFIAGWVLGVARLAWAALAPCFAAVFCPFSLVFLGFLGLAMLTLKRGLRVVS